MTKRHQSHLADIPLRRRNGALLVNPSAAHGYQNGNTVPNHADPESRENQGRKRIAVACSRCRKRKIKCTGDPGNGSGCLACRNSNQASGPCQFLRVNAQEISNVYADCGQTSTVSSLYNPNADVGFYNTPIPLGTSQGVIPGPRFPRHYVSNVYYGTMPMAPEGYSQHGEGVIESLRYGNAPPTYGPLSGNSFSQVTSASSGYHQALPSRSDGYDPESLKYGTSMHMSSSDQDPHSPFPTMDVLMHTLPNPSASSQRTLPDPRGCQNATPVSVDGTGGEQMLSIAPSILKSQSFVPLAPVSSGSSMIFSSTSILPPSTEATGPDSPIRRSSLKPNYVVNDGIANPFSNYNISSQVTAGLHSPDIRATSAVMHTMSNDPQIATHGRDSTFDVDPSVTNNGDSMAPSEPPSQKVSATNYGPGKRSRRAKSPRGYVEARTEVRKERPTEKQAHVSS